jgi:hypothetical protein
MSKPRGKPGAVTFEQFELFAREIGQQVIFVLNLESSSLILTLNPHLSGGSCLTFTTIAFAAKRCQ